VARQRSRAGRQDAAPATPAPPASPPSAEEQLIYIGLNYPAWRERIAAALAPEDVRDLILRRIFTEFIQSVRPDDSAGSQGNARPLSLQPPDVQRRLASLWARDPWSVAAEEPGDFEADGEGPEALRRTVEDCLARISQTRAGAERQALRQALEAADRRGDPEQALRLLAEHPSVKHGRGTQ
jgi:hypothetical protein